MAGHGSAGDGRACASRGSGGNRDLGDKRVGDNNINGGISDRNGSAGGQIMAIIKGDTTASEGRDGGGSIRGV